MSAISVLDFPVITIVLLGAICGACAAAVASSKDHDLLSWFWAGFFLGPFALVAAAGLPDLRLRRYMRLIAEQQGAVVTDPIKTPEFKDNSPDVPGWAGPGGWGQL